MNDAGIAHQEAMIANLQRTFKEVNGYYNQINDMVFQQKPSSECREAMAHFETKLEAAEKAIKDAESIVTGHERRVAAEKRKAEAPKGKAKAKAKTKAENTEKTRHNLAALAKLKSETFTEKDPNEDLEPEDLEDEDFEEECNEDDEEEEYDDDDEYEEEATEET